MTSSPPLGPRVRAPELQGRGWLNTGGKALTLADLRGKIILLDFWTFCCVNCLHVLDELRPLEERYDDVLTVIGVHSPKFEHEKDPEALAAAVERYGVRHPVLDDPQLIMWDRYAARAWPTLCVVDPEGYVVATMAGEGHAAGLAALVDELSEPQGLCLLPPPVAEVTGYDLVVADTVNHLLRGVRLADGEVSTVAGTGRHTTTDGRGATDAHAHDALAADLSSPWDLAWYDDRLIIAMAGIHQLWWFDPVKRTVGVYAGTTVEALRDGPLAQAWLAQPSGLSARDGRLWVVDSESSALRFVADGAIHTAVGQGLFDFGHVDGPATEALLQHPLGVLALPEAVLVADTYNGAVRRYADGAVSTVATGLAEPSDLVLTPDGDVVVVESAAHRLSRLAPGASWASTWAGPAGRRSTAAAATRARYRTERPVTDIAAGELALDVVFTLPPGQKLDDSFGVPTRLEVSASPPDLLVEGAGVSTDLSRALRIAAGVTEGVIQVTAQAATCDADAEHAACHLTRQDWGVPVRVTPGGASHLPLVLRG